MFPAGEDHHVEDEVHDRNGTDRRILQELERRSALGVDRDDFTVDRGLIRQLRQRLEDRGIRADDKGADAERHEEEHRHDHAALAALSTRGTVVIAERSGHHVQLDQPELVAQAVTEVLTAVKR